MDGFQKDDFTLILGYPASTERYLTASGIQDKLDYYFPPLIDIFGKKLKIMKAHMDASETVKIKYAEEYATDANTWKYMVGQQRGVINLDLVGEKKAFEKEFNAWTEKYIATHEKYGNVIRVIDSSNCITRPCRNLCFMLSTVV